MAKLEINYWLLKTEPTTYSFEKLEKQNRTHWDGVRNFQARKFLTQIKKGDIALIYHSGDDKAVVGLAQVAREAYPDPDPKKPGDWVQIDIEAIRPMKRAISLAEIKATPSLADLILIKQSRLSVMPVSAKHYEIFLHLEKSPAPAPSTKTRRKVLL